MSSHPAPGAHAPSGDTHRSDVATVFPPLFELLPVALCLLAPDRRILRANPALAELFGQAAETPVEGRPFGAVAPAELASGLEACLRSPHGRPAFTCRWRGAGETDTVAEATVTPDGTGGLLLAICDRTDRWLLDATRRQSRHYRGLATLADGFAHEFNNVLAIIMGHACLLRDVTGDRQRVAQIGDIIIDASRRATTIVKQVASFSGQNGTEKARIDLHQLLARAVDRWRWPDAITVHRDPQATDPHVSGIPGHLEQCLDHLFANAVDAMPKGGTLTVSTELTTRLPRGHPGAPAQFLHLTVADTGRGMDRATLTKLFDPPVPGEANRRPRGFGLVVVSNIVRAHHGFIEVDSTPGAGTRVNLFFPSPPADPLKTTSAPGARAAAGAAGTRQERRAVLMVEDEPDIGALMMEIFRRHGISVLWARDAEEGLSIYRRHSAVVGAVFTDVGLPGMDGLEMCRNLRQIAPKIPLLISSGYLHGGTGAELSGAPTLFLKKPYEYGEVVARIGQLLGAQQTPLNE